MRLDAIRSFLAVVEVGSYAAAAESLYSSATTLHSHVKSIQDELGVTLFTFPGRHLELTPAGHQFLLFAERFNLEYSAMLRDLRDRQRDSQFIVRIMAPYGPSVHLLPPVVRAFQQKHPAVLVSVRTGQRGESLAGLASRQIDLAVMSNVGILGVGDSIERRPVYADRLVAIIRSDLRSGADIDLFERYPVAVQPPGAPSRESVERWARREGMELNVAFEHAAFDGIVYPVLRGDAIGFVSGYAVEYALSRGAVQVLDLPSLDVIRTITVLHRPAPPLAVAAFVDLLAEYYQERMHAREAGTSRAIAPMAAEGAAPAPTIVSSPAV